eukprot:Skav201353  [mRNA]  locus=scaffold2643:79499:86442:- [translate_table: standard]
MWIRPDGGLRQLQVIHGCVVQQHPGVQRHDGVLGGDQRIDVALLDLWQIQDEHRKAHHDIDQLIHVDAAHASHTQESFVKLRVLQHLPRQIWIQRRQGHGRILKDLHQSTAGAKE